MPKQLTYRYLSLLFIHSSNVLLCTEGLGELFNCGESFNLLSSWLFEKRHATYSLIIKINSRYWKRGNSGDNKGKKRREISFKVIIRN